MNIYMHIMVGIALLGTISCGSLKDTTGNTGHSGPVFPSNTTTNRTGETAQNSSVVNILIGKQKVHFPKILTELKAESRKVGHWIWWVFPTEKPGDSESEPRTFVNLLTAEELLSKANIDAWSEILEKIYELLENEAMGPLKTAHNIPNPAIIPTEDHGRINHALAFWLEKAVVFTKKYPRFFNALEKLKAFDWKKA